MRKMNSYLMMAVFVTFLFVTSAFADTFDPPKPVYVSGDASGLIYYKSDYPEALDVIQGHMQFRNDIMKRNGTGRNKNAFREAVRVNLNLLTVQMYPETLNKQFSFNVMSGPLWGNIPSCNLIPDGKTVIIEDSYPINKSEKKDSENGEGGAHFSLIAHLSDMSLVNPMPFDASACGGSRVVKQAPKPAPAPKTHVRKTVVKKIPCPDGKGICSQPCIVEIREGVEYLVSSVGMWTKDEPVEERTLQQKARITLDSLGKPDKDDAADDKTVQQKLRNSRKQSNANHATTHKAIGKSKKGNATLHQQHETTHDKIDKMQKDIDTIKAEVLKTGGHTTPPAGTSKNQPSCSTVGCHAPSK